MTTIAWLLILGAAVMIRSVAKGRVTELPGDARDMLLGALTGDFAAVKEAAGRTGEGLTAPSSDAVASSVAAGAAGAVASARAASLLAETKRLGTGKAYIWGGTFAAGGAGGDCSGLVWRALKNLGIYTGPRFTTVSFPAVSPKFSVPVASPLPGDIVVWQRLPTGHMGIVTGPDVFYSALSRKAGVRESKISAERGVPKFYRLK
jgi:cell wall-associated NlpC family hydrolase